MVSHDNPRVDWTPLWIGAAFAVALIGLDIVLRPAGASLTREHGGIELASALMYVYAVMVWLRRNPPSYWGSHWHLPAIMLFGAAREFDLDKSLTSVGIFKSNLYLTDQAPIWERLIGLVVLVVLVWAVIRLVRLHARTFLHGLQRGDSGSWAVLGAIGVAGIAKSIDGIGRKLRPFGITVDSGLEAWAGIAEELMELFIPFFLLYAVLEASRHLTQRR